MVQTSILRLVLFCNFVPVTKENVEYTLNIYISDELKVKPRMLHKEQISKTTSKLSPSQDFVLTSSDGYSTHPPPVCSHVLTPRKSLLLIAVTFR